MSELVVIDCNYFGPEIAAAFLVVEGGRAAFIETNTAHAVPILLRALEDQDLKAEQVDYVIVTHAHLDHAGGAGELMRLCPNAKLLAHPRAAKHLIDPTKLIASAKVVYGEKQFLQLYGDLKPIPAERVQVMEDGAQLGWATRTFSFLHTRGHANHHMCIHDSGSNTVFTGDAFGLAYPALQTQGLFIFPTTSPTDFDPVEARVSIKRILATGAESVHLTHFGKLTNFAEAAEQLEDHLEFCEGLLHEASASKLSDAELDKFCEGHMRRFLAKNFEAREMTLGLAAWKLLDLDIKLNAAGISWVAKKRRAKGDAKNPS
ncbi:MBL fold metallo-hydrolase [Bdellovibrionota bacterium FG-2]